MVDHLIAVVSAGLMIYARVDQLATGSAWLILAGLAIAWLGLCERHRRFAPLAGKALYSQFIALHGRGGSTAPPSPTGRSGISVVE